MSCAGPAHGQGCGRRLSPRQRVHKASRGAMELHRHECIATRRLWIPFAAGLTEGRGWYRTAVAGAGWTMAPRAWAAGAAGSPGWGCCRPRLHACGCDDARPQVSEAPSAAARPPTTRPCCLPGVLCLALLAVTALCEEPKGLAGLEAGAQTLEEQAEILMEFRVRRGGGRSSVGLGRGDRPGSAPGFS